MHHALEIHEILLNIFGHCIHPLSQKYKHGRQSAVGSDLVAAARTCRVFKEPALDVLWYELPNLCPLAQCLPEVSYKLPRGSNWYSFKRPLEETEWDTLRSYTRRVRSVLDFESAFHPDCVRKFLNSSPEPLFPNLRHLRCMLANETTPLLLQPLPSLTTLDYLFVFEGCLPQFRESLQSFSKSSSYMRRLSIRVDEPDVSFDELVSDFICRWSNPQVVFCPQVSLDMQALAHLSRVPGLNQLSFAANAAFPEEITLDTLLFSTLQRLKIFPESLDLISRLFAHVQLPAITNFTVEMSSCPSKPDMISFLSALKPSGVADSVTELTLSQIYHPSAAPLSNSPVLGVNDLRPIMALTHLRHINLNLGWDINLTDKDLLELASSWPHLEQLLINEEWGWQTVGGITPNGLVRLLQTCRSLARLSLAIDTRGYTDIPPVQSPASLGLGPSRASFSLDVVDSVIEAESVAAMAAFLDNVIPSAQFSLSAWRGSAFVLRSGKKVYADRWNDVRVVVSALRGVGF